ncbi:Stk1 family PASTA domain-containing Ser/Thr kinase [Clostridium sp. AF20-17LB]|nr:Stk1 family PASTA domain-containing Ser/Thr kinase [Clostridium sp. AF20-17LB]RHR05772.1 Stk1 family PASTA domain-containing Ser/Thr kinase [Clostridium sp. AF20-17LB]
MILYPGTMLQDRYEILEKIGSGGMSDVYKAKCHKLNRLVAIKVLKSEFTSDATFVSKFKMEAQAAAGLSHPNIVNIYDVVDEGDIHFIVMELVEGITLKSYITKKGHLEVKEAIGIAIQVASGIEAAHEQHIIHRDIKPQNMLISMDGKVKVADFGIARAVSSQTMNAATVVGSVHYISPEQARGGYSDERSDLYSLGITMFEMVTGHVPFEGDNTVTVALAHLEDPMPDPRTLNPEVSPSLARIILKCTEKRPERRYPSAAAVISDLRRALLNDDDPNVGVIEEEDHSSDTIVISPNELNMIKTRSGERIRESKPVKEIRERRERRDLEKRYEQPEDAKKDQKKSKENDEATGLEKILTGLGVAAAVIIVAVVIVFILKLGGLFRSSTPEDPTEQVSQEATTEEAKTTAVSETTISQKEVYMPNLVGRSQDEAEKILQGLDLSMQVEQENSDDVEKGMVISQKEKPDTVLPRFSKVTVVISAGSDKVDLAELGLSGMTLETAVRLLEGKNLKADVQEESSEDVPSGTIIRYEPEDKVALGSTVTLYVSTGPEEEFVSVPNLYGKTDAEASVLLSAAGLVAGEISKEYDSTISAGHVISQGVEAGTQVAPGETVDYTVSLGPEAPKKQFIASLDASYPLQVSYGPGAASSEIQILIRLKQTVNGKVTYTKLAEPKSYSADTTLNIKLDKIRGADGVQTGEVEIVDLTNNVVLTSYNVTFTEVDS